MRALALLLVLVNAGLAAFLINLLVSAGPDQPTRVLLGLVVLSALNAVALLLGRR